MFRSILIIFLDKEKEYKFIHGCKFYNLQNYTLYMIDKEIKVDQILLSYVSKPGKKGPTYYFNIPNQYIKDGHIKPEKTYRLYLEELKDDER